MVVYLRVVLTCGAARGKAATGGYLDIGLAVTVLSSDKQGVGALACDDTNIDEGMPC